MTPQNPGYGAAPRLSEGSYEFNGEENMRIERAGSSSSVWAACAMIGAILLGILAGLQIYLKNVRGALLVAPLFLMCAVAGWLYFGTGKALKEVVTTQGNDIELLMRALQRLTRAFRYEVITTIFALVLLVVLTFVVRMV